MARKDKKQRKKLVKKVAKKLIKKAKKAAKKENKKKEKLNTKLEDTEVENTDLEKQKMGVSYHLPHFLRSSGRLHRHR